jgi:magnesium-transporting ATPase (P-type)
VWSTPFVAAAPIFVARGRLIGLLALVDPLRPEAQIVIQALQERGVVDIIMLTGDHPAVARKVADTVGIARYLADVLPDQKAELVRTLQGDRPVASRAERAVGATLISNGSAIVATLNALRPLLDGITITSRCG